MNLINPANYQVFCVRQADFEIASRLFNTSNMSLNTLHFGRTPGGFIKLRNEHSYMFINLTRKEYGYTDTPDFPVVKLNVTVELVLNDPARQE
jgi:hypothetical protein